MSASLAALTPVYLTREIREIERQAFAPPSPLPLMERAGLATAELARRLAADSGAPILVVAGPGNNGGDALVAARYLKQWWFDVALVFAGGVAKLPDDARAAYEAWRAAGGNIVTALPENRRWTLVLDGLFGIGLQRDLSGAYAELVGKINALDIPVLAIDVPSGIEADSGRAMGCAVRASHTLTFIARKPGLLTLDGPDHCGEIAVAALGLDAAAMRSPRGRLLDAGVLADVLPPRRRNSHKGDYGSVGIVGGAPGMSGAALLAGRAALNLGAGRVYVGMLDEQALRSIDVLQPELMLRAAHEVLKFDQVTALAVGPGLGQSPDAGLLLAQALEAKLPLVLDADALNLIARNPALAGKTRERTAATLLTPHPAEAARLLGAKTADVQRDRVQSACDIASRFNAHIVLKGAGSICAHPDGRWLVNTSGNPGMASAGMGDALSGLVAALLAQGADPAHALVAGVYLHGAAADRAAATGYGPVGLTATDVIAAARSLFNRVPATTAA